MMEQFVFKGIIDENFDFSEIKTSRADELYVVSRDVIRITSAGLKGWLETFNKLRSSEKKIRFLEVAPSLIRQTIYVKGILRREEVVSLCTEFVCAKCGTKKFNVYTVSELEKLNYELPLVSCPKCQATMDFDDLKDRYFSLLKP